VLNIWDYRCQTEPKVPRLRIVSLSRIDASLGMTM
jgi:hypothetical protein